MKPARLNWIDYARGIAIILVSYRHVFEGSKEAGVHVEQYPFLEYCNIFFYSFRMPLFFIISGIFISKGLQKRGIKKFVETRARSILYPYFIWGFLQLSLQMVFTRYTNGHPEPKDYLHLFYLPREIAQFWYLYALFNVGLLFSVIKAKFKAGYITNLIIGLLFYYVSVLVYQHDWKVGFLSDVMHYYIFFAIGDIVSSYLLDAKNYRFFESGKTLLLMLIPFILVQTYFLIMNMDHADSKYMYVEFYQPFVFLLIALVGCAFIINLTFYLQKKDVLKWLIVLGRHSLYIYVAHVIVFASVRILLNKIFHVENVPVLLLSGILAGLLVPLYLYKLAVKLNMRWIFTLEKDEQQAKPAGAPAYAVPHNEKNNSN